VIGFVTAPCGSGAAIGAGAGAASARGNTKAVMAVMKGRIMRSGDGINTVQVALNDRARMKEVQGIIEFIVYMWKPIKL